MQVIARKGDTFERYSQLFNVPLRLIIDSNPEIAHQALAPEQIIKIPGYLTDIQKIEEKTLWQIITERQISTEVFFLLNGEVHLDRIKSEQSVKLPIRVRKPVISCKKPYDFETLVDDFSKLAVIYPFLLKNEFGKSVMGKPLLELKIGRGKQKIHFNGSFHATEWITTPVLMLFFNEYLLALTNRGTIRGLYMAPFYEKTSLSVVPMVNPDGVDLVIHGLPEVAPHQSQVLKINQGSEDFSDWKANINGVDLNNQFPAHWETEAKRKIKHPAPKNYPGEIPLSQPESKAIAELTKQSDFDRVLAFHTQGEEIYWGFQTGTPTASERIVEEFARVSGYQAVELVDSYAGYKDWFIQHWRKPGFTIELGKGQSPLSLSKFSKIYQEALGLFLAALYM